MNSGELNWLPGPIAAPQVTRSQTLPANSEQMNRHSCPMAATHVRKVSANVAPYLRNWHYCARPMVAMQATKSTNILLHKASVEPQLLEGMHEQPRQTCLLYVQGDHLGHAAQAPLHVARQIPLPPLLSDAHYCQLRKQSYMG